MGFLQGVFGFHLEFLSLGYKQERIKQKKKSKETGKKRSRGAGKAKRGKAEKRKREKQEEQRSRNSRKAGIHKKIPKPYE